MCMCVCMREADESRFLILSAFLFFFVFLEDSHSDLFVWDSEYTPPTLWIAKETISCGREIKREMD